VYQVLAIKDFLTTGVGNSIFPQHIAIISACQYAY